MIPVFLFVGDTTQQIKVMQTKGCVVGQCVLHQEVRVGTLALIQTLVALVQVNAITLNPG